MQNLTSLSVNLDLQAIAQLKDFAHSVIFGMNGREVVMVVDCLEHSRMKITGDVLGNGLNRNACEKELFWNAIKSAPKPGTFITCLY